MVVIDYSGIEQILLKENHNVGLAFSEGYVFFRVMNGELVWYTYDPKLEGVTNLANIAATTYIAKQLFSSSSTRLNVPNVLRVDKNFHLYQVFMGVKPSQARVFLSPEGTDQREIDVSNWGTGSVYGFGYVDGRQSPFGAPTKQGEFFLTPQIGQNFSVYNPMPYTISPLFSFTINRMEIAVIKDATTIQKILQGVIPARLGTVGGGLSPPKYGMQSNWKVKPVKLDASFDEIKAAVS